MGQPYPQPVFNSTTDMFSYVNTITDNWSFILFLIASAAILFLIMHQKNYKTSSCLVVSLFLTFVLSSMLWAAGLVAGQIVVLFLTMSLGAIIYSMFDS